METSSLISYLPNFFASLGQKQLLKCVLKEPLLLPHLVHLPIVLQHLWTPPVTHVGNLGPPGAIELHAQVQQPLLFQAEGPTIEFWVQLGRPSFPDAAGALIREVFAYFCPVVAQLADQLTQGAVFLGAPDPRPQLEGLDFRGLLGENGQAVGQFVVHGLQCQIYLLILNCWSWTKLQINQNSQHGIHPQSAWPVAQYLMVRLNRLNSSILLIRPSQLVSVSLAILMNSLQFVGGGMPNMLHNSPKKAWNSRQSSWPVPSRSYREKIQSILFRSIWSLSLNWLLQPMFICPPYCP